MGQKGLSIVGKKRWFKWRQLFWEHFLEPTTTVWWLEGWDCWWNWELCWVMNLKCWCVNWKCSWLMQVRQCWMHSWQLSREARDHQSACSYWWLKLISWKTQIQEASISGPCSFWLNTISWVNIACLRDISISNCYVNIHAGSSTPNPNCNHSFHNCCKFC